MAEFSKRQCSAQSGMRIVALLVLASLVLSPAEQLASQTSGSLPERLSDPAFWRLAEDLSEPESGTYVSDNLLSNEILFAQVLPALTERAGPSGVYLGVGPEQNFTFIAGLKPKIAFIADIRRVNWHLHLMYKALFEQSADRAESCRGSSAGSGPMDQIPSRQPTS